MRSKKGIVEVQFNWIFILIVGAIILMFFISIVVQGSRTSNRKTAAQITFDMSSIFSGALVSTNTEHIVEIPPIDIYFECDNNTGYSSYRVSDSEAPIGDGLIVFSPSYVSGKGRELLTWSTDWNVPYRVSNFLYVTAPAHRYIIVEGSTPSQAQYVFDNLPDQMQKGANVVTDLQNIDDKNNYKVTIVILYNSSIVNPEGAIFVVPPSLMTVSDDDLSLIYVEPILPHIATSIKETGMVYFYKKNNTVFSYDGKSSFVGEASLYGSIYSENVENYNCNMQKAFKRLTYLTGIYEKKAENLLAYYNFYPDPQNCASKIGDAKTDLINILSISKFTESNVNTFYSYINDLKGHNKNIQRYSCPVIY